MRCSGVEVKPYTGMQVFVTVWYACYKDKREEVVENVKREVFRQEFEIKEMEEERRREEGTI